MDNKYVFVWERECVYRDIAARETSYALHVEKLQKPSQNASVTARVKPWPSWD